MKNNTTNKMYVLMSLISWRVLFQENLIKFSIEKKMNAKKPNITRNTPTLLHSI